MLQQHNNLTIYLYKLLPPFLEVLFKIIIGIEFIKQLSP